MKTNLFKNQKVVSNSKLLEMSKDEQKNVQGGIRIILVRDSDGNYEYIFYHD